MHRETSEMGYRTDFEILIQNIFESINVKRIDHDANARQGNKPDFVILKHDIPILYIETKNIGLSLDKIEKSEQMARYFGYANLVLTDYLEFRFYRNGVRYEEPIKIGEYNLKDRTIIPSPDQYEHLVQSLLDFTQSHREPIKSGKHLSKIMGGKAQRIRDNIKQFLGKESERNSILLKVYETIKELLVHDLVLDDFADMYAQTLVYGLFVARFYDKTTSDFTRQEARDLIPASNPFLRQFFDHIVGPDFDKRLEYIVDELCEVFAHADVQKLMKQYYKTDTWGKKHEGPDPVIHFYEDFLKEYDDDLRKAMGAYYTPQPVVRFIVRAVDDLLQKDFGLASGLADTTKTSKGVHKVQVLDPAVGTGTFISAVIRQIYEKLLKEGQKGRWPAYVHHDLLPRIFGFELMMAPYTIAHLKLSMAFKETGFWNFHRRLGIYLTNSLEESAKQESLFSGFGLVESIANESKEAEVIKNKKPIMVVVGNPPYNVSSSNKGKWIQDLIKIYKKNLNERKINLDDDYIKFIRFAEHFIEKNKSGIVAMITNNSFIDGITHRQMRKHLLDTFDDIYILDLHGNSKKKEVDPKNGGKDENVFDIQQGVSINIFVKQDDSKKQLATVYHADLYGKRAHKFKYLDEHGLKNIKWNKLKYSDPYYFYVPRNTESEAEYHKGIKIDELFLSYNSGIQTKKDALAIKFTNKELDEVINNFLTQSADYLRTKYDLKDTSGWNVGSAKDSLQEEYQKTTLLYRPFDFRKSVIQKKSGGFIGRSRYKTAKHFVNDNLGLITVRQQSTFDFQHALVTNCMIESGAISLQTKEWGYIFPLYHYSDDGSKHSNLNQDIVIKIQDIVGDIAPEDILDYIYAMLYSQNYRIMYKELLKIDFPRIPYPKNKKKFYQLVKLGLELRSLHLLESPKINSFITTYPVAGSDVVGKPEYKNGNVYINSEQYFGKVPELAWNFYIGGYQPAQKWLKYRRDRKLTNADIEHFQKIIVILVQTDKLMRQIDKTLNET